MTSTPRYGHAPITMRRVPESKDLERVGDFCWQIGESGRRALVVFIPDRDVARGWSYSRWTIGFPNHCGAQWSWDGKEDKPTLSPSLHAVGTWHGWVRAGELTEA